LDLRAFGQGSSYFSRQDHELRPGVFTFPELLLTPKIQVNQPCQVQQADRREHCRFPVRMIEEPDTDQAKILQAFGYKIKEGVLQGL